MPKLTNRVDGFFYQQPLKSAYIEISWIGLREKAVFRKVLQIVVMVPYDR